MRPEKKLIPVTIENEDGSTKEVEIYVSKPINTVVKGADRYRAKAWNECVADGVMTKEALTAMMVEKKLWDDDSKKDSPKNKLIAEIQKLEKSLYLGDEDKSGKTIKPKLSDGQKKAVEIRRKRVELRDIIMSRVSQEENTAEALADNARFDYLVAGCTFYEGGEKVYKDVEDYNERSADILANTAAQELASLMYSLDNNFEANLPENKWLVNHKLVNEDLSLVNSSGDLVDLDGRKINDDGYYVNEEGKPTDEAGNVLNEDGTYADEIVYEDDLEATPKKVAKKRTPKAAKITDS